MASKLSFTEEDFSCPVCREVFTDPVLLPCTHSFCSACLQEWWRTTQEKDCPLCKERHATAPPLNLALKNLCETFTQRTLQRSTEVLCGLHAESFKLFCQECLQPVCVVCRESKEHTDHRCRPVDEAALDYKKEVGKSLWPLKYKLDTFKTVKTKCDQTAEHLKVQAENAETQIKEVFKILHKYLRDDEEARITALRKEQQQKSRMMTEKMEGLNGDISTISNAIRDLEEELKAEHVSFLQNYRTTVEKVQLTLPPDPQPVSGELMDVAGHLKTLAFGVGIVSYRLVILDPNTAWTRLVLSDDLTSVSGLTGDTASWPLRASTRGLTAGTSRSETADSWEADSWVANTGE